MIIAIGFLMLAAMGLIVYGLTIPKSDIGVRLDIPRENTLKKIINRSLLTRLIPFSQQLLSKLKLEEPIKHKLDASRMRLSAVEFLNIKILLIIILLIVAIVISGKFDPINMLIAIAAAYILPEIYLQRKITQRKHLIAKLLPETVDLLGLCVEAGLDFTSATKWIIEKVKPNPMIEELAFVLEEIKWGKSRSQALKDMSKRLNIPEVSSFVLTLVQAERMGTSVSETFAIISEDTRLQRFHQGERIASQAPIKILVPLIFCILPVIAIIVGGPIFLQFMQGGLLQSLGK